jgi:hypothetical protein
LSASGFISLVLARREDKGTVATPTRTAVGAVVVEDTGPVDETEYERFCRVTANPRS